MASNIVKAVTPLFFHSFEDKFNTKFDVSFENVNNKNEIN